MSREMKDSGLPWIGEIPTSWIVDRVKFHLRVNECKGYPDATVLSLYRDLGVIPKDSRDDNHNVTSDDTSKYKHVEVGDFVLNKMKAWQGSVAVSDYEGIVSPAYYVYKFTSEAFNRKYFHYLLRDKSYTPEYRRLSGGIREGQWDLSRVGFENLSVIVPPLSEQQAIADYLDQKTAEIDAAINEAKSLIEKYKAYKQSVIKEIFDYYLSTEPYVKAKLGSLSKLVTKQTGFDYSNTISPSLVGELTEDTIPYIQTRHFKDNYWNYDTEYYIPKQVASLFPQIILNKRCLLFSIVGASIGNVAVYPGDTTAFLGGAICKVDLVNENDYDYIKNYMMSRDGQEQIFVHVKASAQGTITVQNVRDFRIPLFKEKAINDRISAKVNDISKQIYSIVRAKEQLVAQLQEYKKSVIFEYVTGKKEVPNG